MGVVESGWKVSEVAGRAHVTVRTLHHYDSIGLLAPSGRSSAGYRVYSDADVERLFQILMFRELGLPLEEIRRLLDAPAAVRHDALRTHRELLLEKRQRTEAVIRAVDRALHAMEGGTGMKRDELDEAFDALANAPGWVRDQHAEHGAEAQRRWGDTDEYRESMRRAVRHSKADWQQIRDEGEANEARMAALLAAGGSPQSPEAMDAAESMREHIERWFYPCSHAMHVGLADMYQSDPRFAAHYDNRLEGLASFVAEAIRATAERAQG